MIKRARVSSFLLAASVAVVGGCAPKPPLLPSGGGPPFPEFASAYTQATASCRGVKTITASMAVSGRVGTAKLRGRIDAGFEAPARARLEGIAPFGKPVFILVATGARGTLVLPREDRVLRDAAPDQIVEALAGVRLGPDALRSIVSGCVFGVGVPQRGYSIANMVAVDLGDTMVYLRRSGNTWELFGGDRFPVLVLYSEFSGGRPTRIRLVGQSSSPASSADLTLRLSDVDINTTLNPKTFQTDLPANPIPLTLDELRRAGPLGGS